VGPAGLPRFKEIKYLPTDGTLEILDVFLCLSQRKISTSGLRRWKDIAHSVYVGRERLGRYVQTDWKKYTAFDANDRQLGNFRIRSRALAAIRKAQAKRK
jgi:predicted phage tail protein